VHELLRTYHKLTSLPVGLSVRGSFGGTCSYFLAWFICLTWSGWNRQLAIDRCGLQCMLPRAEVHEGVVHLMFLFIVLFHPVGMRNFEMLNVRCKLKVSLPVQSTVYICIPQLHSAVN